MIPKIIYKNIHKKKNWMTSTFLLIYRHSKYKNARYSKSHKCINETDKISESLQRTNEARVILYCRFFKIPWLLCALAEHKNLSSKRWSEIDENTELGSLLGRIM